MLIENGLTAAAQVMEARWSCFNGNWMYGHVYTWFYL